MDRPTDFAMPYFRVTLRKLPKYLATGGRLVLGTVNRDNPAYPAGPSHVVESCGLP